MRTRRELLVYGLTICLGCSSPVIRPQSPEFDLEASSEADLIGDFARSYGMNFLKVEAVSLVTGLDSTGEDPAPSPQRGAVLAEMQRRKVDRPEDVLASPNTSIAVLRGYLRPGIQEGDRFDIEVRVPSRSETKSLRGGWLLEARMTEMALLGNQIRKGHLLALGEGAVLVDPAAKLGSETEVHLKHGRVLGGGVALKSRDLGLVLDDERRSFRGSAQIGKSINQRFHTYIRGRKQGVAVPKTDQFIELKVHPRYKDNVGRYMRVVRNIAYRESPTRQQQRMRLLERQLFDPVTSQMAALRLEAIGKDAIEILKRGIESKDAEVRFYAAEALAYLDDPDSVRALAEAARDEPAFRVHSLSALSAMDDVTAHDALRGLLDEESAETRYGAFRALWAMNKNDPLVQGEILGDEFSYHALDTKSSPMIHITRSLRPEIVLFGRSQTIHTPVVLEAGKNILVNSRGGNQVTVSRFAVGQPDQKRLVSNRVDEMIRAIVELGGTYPDVVQALYEAKQLGAIDGRLRFDALPESGRSFKREFDDPEESFN